MSVKAMTWVFEHSPYELGQRLVHLALADVANDDYDNRLWLTRELVAKKCRVSVSTVARSVASMVAAGYLEVVTPGGGRGKPTEYRMVFPEEPPQYDTVSVDKPCHQGDETVSSHRETVSSATIAPITNSRNSRERKNLAAAPPKATDDPIKRTAHRLTVLAFEQPVVPELRNGGGSAFSAAMKLIERVLRAGKSDREIEEAIKVGVEVWTLAGLQTAIAQTKPRRNPLSRGGPSLGDLHSAALAAEQRKSQGVL